MRVVLALLLVPALAGCFTLASTITVRPDGSGTIRDSVAVSGIGALAFQDPEDDKDGGLVDKARLQARAAALGEGVTLMGMEETESGYVALYAFPDVRALRYAAPNLPLGEDDNAKTIADEAFDLSFDFEEGDPATLRITVPDNEAPASDDGPAAEPTAQEREQAQRGIEMLRALLGDAHVRLALVLDGDVVETDAAVIDGSTLTFVDIVFDELLDVMEEHPELMRGDEPPTHHLQTLLAGHEGIAIQPPGVVTVRFE